MGDAAVPAAPDSKPTKWWQWVLLYPSLAIGVLTGTPTLVDKAGAAYTNITRDGDQPSISSLSDAQSQAKMWLRNRDCNTLLHAWVSTTSQIRVDTTICPDTGDVLVQALTPNNRQFQKWISAADQVINNAVDGRVHTSSINLGGVAMAATPLDTDPAIFVPSIASARKSLVQMQILCQRQLDQRTLLRRIGTPNGCFDLIIDMYTGQVVRQVPAPCAVQC